jgi:hypothetical protein
MTRDKGEEMSKLTEKDLKEFESLTYIEDLTTCGWDDFYELIRLARLGLFMEELWSPVLDDCQSDSCSTPLDKEENKSETEIKSDKKYEGLFHEF